MKIKYKIKCGTCLTPCPNKQRQEGSIPMVASSACNYCEYFVSDNEEDKTIECSYKRRR